MSKWIAIALFVFFPGLLIGNVFFENSDPALFHHVNVVTGDLSLIYEDVNIGGVVPYTVPRTYSNSGCSSYESTERKKDLSGSPWFFRGGWTLLAHGNLHLQAIREEAGGTINRRDGPFYYYSIRPSIIEKNNSALGYSLKGNCKFAGKGEYLPNGQRSPKSPHPNPRRNPLNNRLALEETKATLFRSDGSIWHYSGDTIEEMFSYESYYADTTTPKLEKDWRLDLEILPSKHRVVYKYDEANWLKKIEVQNPAGNKVFGYFNFDHEGFEETRKLKIRTSEGRAFEYAFNAQNNDQFYLDSVTSSSRPFEQVCYQAGGKEKELRIETIKFGGNTELGVTYYEASQKSKRRNESLKKRAPELRRVASIICFFQIQIREI
ncbi:MAG: hypothetical protein P0S96_04895 [Simkaniaceae bacterium]|nr:hypothetical protein [Candidatus Sacchlamyda saccharinae]